MQLRSESPFLTFIGIFLCSKTNSVKFRNPKTLYYNTLFLRNDIELELNQLHSVSRTEQGRQNEP